MVLLLALGLGADCPPPPQPAIARTEAIATIRITCMTPASLRTRTDIVLLRWASGKVYTA